MTAALLVAAIAAYCWFLSGAPRSRGVSRPQRYRRWLTRAWLAFGATGLLALLLLGRGDAVWRLPGEFVPLAERWTGGPGDTGVLAAASAVGIMGGMLAGLLIARARRRRGRSDLRIGQTGALLPRDRVELAYAAAVCVTAGITEELFFRLLLPLLIALATGSAAIGFVVATLLFGWAHRYQRWAGVLVSTVVGTVLALLYLRSGALWLAMLAHVLLDVNGMVLRPAFAGAWRGRD